MQKEAETGIDQDAIDQAQILLNLQLPNGLVQAWKIHNVIQLELQDGWQVFPIFNPSSPRKTASHIVYENTRSHWRDAIDDDLLMIANNGTGDHLVVRVVNAVAQEHIFHWHHETDELQLWEPGMQAILHEAQRSREAVTALQKKYRK